MNTAASPYDGFLHVVKSDRRTYLPNIGAYCVAKLKKDELHEVRWVYCRETFQRRRGKLDYLLFCHGQERGEDLVRFMKKVDEKLGLKQKNTYGATQRKNIMWIKLSPWWTRYSMRMSLFTILLRVGQNYYADKDNFDDAMFSHAYTSETRYAVQRFMGGHTKYVGRRVGWYNQFKWGGCHYVPCPPPPQMVDQLLVKP